MSELMRTSSRMLCDRTRNLRTTAIFFCNTSCTVAALSSNDAISGLPALPAMAPCKLCAHSCLDCYYLSTSACTRAKNTDITSSIEWALATSCSAIGVPVPCQSLASV